MSESQFVAVAFCNNEHESKFAGDTALTPDYFVDFDENSSFESLHLSFFTKLRNEWQCENMSVEHFIDEHMLEVTGFWIISYQKLQAILSAECKAGNDSGVYAFVSTLKQIIDQMSVKIIEK